MADDIDIEEHDVMDNPQLKSIFPCITNIKTEVIDYEEETDYQEYIDHNKVIKTEPLEYGTKPNINSNVIIFGTKPSTPQPFNKATTSMSKESLINQISYENDYDSDDDGDYSDGIEEDPDIIPCSVVLEDWHSLLANNSCYCSECEILFPTPNTIESHRMTAHSFLVAVNKNKAVKSTSRSSIKDYELNNATGRPDLLCQHCNIYFPSKDDLILHLNSLLPHTEESYIDENSLHADSDTELSNKAVLYARCTICYAFYKHEASFASHVILNHGDCHVEKVMVPFNSYCVHCKLQTSHKIPKYYNNHIRGRHTDMFLMRINYEEGHFQCHICKQTFPSAETERKHREMVHPTNYKHCDSKLKRALMMGPSVKNCKTATTPSNKHASVKSIHIKKNKMIRKNKIKAINPTGIITKNEPATTFDENILVPKSNLFKCDKCQIHYTSPSAAFEHTKQCTLSKGDWRCRPCQRTFNMADRQMHINQHSLNGRFKVIVISEDIYARVLNRCGKCNVCFDDTTFSKYHSSGCKPCPSVECDKCHLKINKFAIRSHVKIHTELGLEISDFIITDYHSIPKSTPIPKNPDSFSDLNCGLQKKVQKNNYTVVYYCPNCKLYTTRHRIQDGHEKGDCINRKCGKELCKLCGLVFSKKAFITHKAYHKMFNIKLNTLTFVNIINGKRIRPPFPEFMCCSNCQVYFVSYVAIQNHVCNTEEHKSCQFCHKKFSDLALKLHLPYHQLKPNFTTVITKRSPATKITPSKKVVGRKESLALMEVNKSIKETETRISTPIHDLIKKYESLVTVWNILYRCQTCDIVFDSYDRTVEHCQDHFCNMESYNLNIKYCKGCKLKFVDNCYSRHEHLHSQNSVGIESFVIIDCDYSLLLSDEWEKVFNKLSKDQLHQVMSKSIYNEMRDVRMELLSDGDLGTVYKCSICKASVHLQFIVDHVKNRECDVGAVKFTCDVCNLGFQKKKTANAHMQKHELTDVPYRIVSFNDPKNLFIDEALIKCAKADDLKFVRCQYCGKLINKSLYRIHIYKHNSRKKKTLLKSQPFKFKNSVGTSAKATLSQVKIDQKGMYRYHVCTICNIALLKYNTHVCRADMTRKKCPKCRVYISATNSSLYRHKRIHKNYPALSHKTIKVSFFNPNEMKKKFKNVIQPNHFIKPAKQELPAVASASLPAPPRPLQKIRYVRCSHCKKCILKKNYRDHRCSYGMKLVECDLCGIHTDMIHYNSHLDMHNRISFTQNDIIVTTFDYKRAFPEQVALQASSPPDVVKTQAIKRDNISSSTDAESCADIVCKSDYIRVYKCTGCKLFFVCRANLLEHLGSYGACDPRLCNKCEDCNLNFHSSDIKQHKTVQFCKTRKVDRINVCTLLLKNTDPNNENNWLSYCKKCDFYNTNAFKRHFDTQHKNAAKTLPCLKCGVRFASLSIRKHNIFHHGDVDIPFSDLNVEVMEDYTLEEVGYVSKTQNDSHNSSQCSIKENIAHTNVHEHEIPNVYRCSTCNLHFHQKASLLSHRVRKEHNVEQVACKICGMPFSKPSARKHLKMHSFTNTFNVIDCLERPSGRASFNSSNTSLNTSDTLDSVPTPSEEVTSNSKMTAPSNQPSQSNLPTVEFKTREAADSSGTSSNEISSTNSVSYANSNIEVKLFKCGECDVYFLTAECCTHHTVNHSPLDPTEYIACKICDLQFLNRSLDEHMKSHREKTFNMDTLVVDEYQPDGQNFKVDTYAAIDRLKSKLVSTTTESD